MAVDQKPSIAGACLKRIPTLDGWRGIAILLVLADHAQLSFMHGYLYEWSSLGLHGVTIFFVLSGFLITTLLRKEGRVDLRGFYLRRVKRLAPAAISYLVVVAIVSFASGYGRELSRGILPCLLFFRNYTEAGTLTGHFWSLSIEEQFYAFWPAVLMIMGPNRALLVGILGIVFCSGLRLLYWSHYSYMPFGFHTEVRVDALLIGCVTALIFERRRYRGLPGRLSARTICVIAILCFPLFALRFHYLIPACESLTIAALIRTTTMRPDLLLSRALEWKPLEFIGRISYSLYLWQMLFFILWNPYLALIGIPCAALLSYYFLEKRDNGIEICL